MPNGGRLLNEYGSIPSYMTMSSDERKKLGNAASVFLKSLWRSTKLIIGNIAFNLKVIGNSFRNDQAAIEKNFEEYGALRNEIHGEMRKDFESLGENDPTKLGTGAMLFAAAMNPALLVSLKYGGGTAAPTTGAAAKLQQKIDEPSEFKGLMSQLTGKASGVVSKSDAASSAAAAAATVAVTKKMSDRLLRASDTFGFGRARVNEQKAVSPTPDSYEMSSNSVDLKQRAKKDFEITKKQAADIEKKLSIYIKVAQKISESKNIEQLKAAIVSASSMGMKLSENGLDEAQSQIRSEIARIEKQKPGSTEEAATAAVKQFPELQGLKPQDIVIQTFAFGAAKGEIMQQLLDLINNMASNAKKMVGLPLDEKTVAALKTSPEGTEYYNFLTGFERRLTGEESKAAQLQK